ncbi:ATP-binding protein [Nocardioides humi]|uniref:ATP-binding protein n=1 Tax=Nocardioides humi TaxID=449461 RepID=UPI0015E84223|nr:LuxR family transcriptional regulator [Nocardioides humi]
MEHATAHLVGRAPELDRLREFIGEAAADGGALLVAGEAGVGKTALLGQAAAYAVESGVRVVRGAGVEFEADVSFAGLHQLLSPLVDQLPQLPPTQARALGVALSLEEGPTPDRLTLANAVTALLRAASATTPLLLVVDDMQWLDLASAIVLGGVGRRLAGSQVGLLGGVRTGEASPVESSGFEEVTVQRLDDDSAAELLTDAFPDLAARDRARLLAAAEGNPLAVLELPRGLADPGTQRPTPVGRRLRGHFTRRLGTLPDAARERLLLAALSGEFPPGPTDLDAAERAGLVHVDPVTGVRFRHPLVRSAVVEASVHAQRRMAHLALAARWPEESEQRAWHLAEAASGPDEDVAALLESAARRTRDRGDPVGAVRLLLRSAALSTTADEHGRRTRLAAFLGIDVTGDLQPVAPTDAGTLEAVVPRAAYLLQTGGDIDTAHRLLVDALSTVADPTDAADPALTEALYVLGSAAFFGSRPGLAEPFHDALAKLSPAPPELLTLLGATFVEPVRLAAPLLERLDHAIAHIGDDPDPARVARIGIAAVYVDRTAGCRDALQQVVQHGRAGGAVTSAIEAMTLLACDAVLGGDWDGVRAIADDGRALADRHGYRLLGGILQYADAMVAAGRGDHERSRSLTSDLVEWAAPSRLGYVLQLAAHADAVADLGRGDHDAAYLRALETCTTETVPAHAPHALWVFLDLVEAAIRSGRRDEAVSHVRHLVSADVVRLSDRLAFAVAAASALVAADDDFHDAFETALQLPDAGRWPFHQARVQLAFGERLRRSKAIAESRHQLRSALATFDRLGARPWSERATVELRASGERVAATAAAATDALTPQQLEIALLAAEGLSNRQIGERLYLSPRTVGTHLYQLFPKLGITSRAALRDALADLSRAPRA